MEPGVAHGPGDVHRPDLEAPSEVHLAGDEHGELALFKKTLTAEARRRALILGASGVASAALIGISISLYLEALDLGVPSWRFLDVLAVAILVLLGPYGFYMGWQLKRIRRLEERFPDFLRDLAVSRRAGLTLASSVQLASRGDYGDLTYEVRRMADEMSWNEAFHEALRRFGERVNTPLVRRAVSLIEEASRAGGNIADVLMATARDAREIKNLENERRRSMGLYTAVIYIVFLVFLGVAAMLYSTFVPLLIHSSDVASGASATGFGIAGTVLTLTDYRTFYFLAALMQGVGNGLVAGVIESGTPAAGMRHAFLMTAISLVAFGALL